MTFRTVRFALCILAGFALSAACGSADDEPFFSAPPDGVGVDAGAEPDAQEDPVDPEATCQREFCPATFGEPCCITARGPCGVDIGMGCSLPPMAGDP